MAAMKGAGGGEEADMEVEFEKQATRGAFGNCDLRRCGASPIRQIRETDGDSAWGDDGHAAEALASGFKLGRLLGRGAFGSVYHATAADGTEVAIKKVSIAGLTSGADREACLKESHLLRQLDHPHIIKCHAVFLHFDEINIVLEYAGAGDLANMLRTMRSMKQRFPESYIWKVFSQVASGLSYMHDRRIMHRDVKPANVFLTSDGVVKVADLGLGRYFASRSDGVTLSVVGTPYYMAPERLAQAEYTYSSDVWSVGCLLYELAALRSPFHISDTDQQNLFLLGQKIVKGEYPPLPAHIYSETLLVLVENCLASDPDDRPTMRSISDCAQCAYDLATRKARTASSSSLSSSSSSSSGRSSRASSAGSSGGRRSSRDSR